MRKIFDARCSSCDTVFETFDRLDAMVRCDCGGEAKRIISPVRSLLDGASGDFPGAAIKWTRDHERKAINGGQR
jgi:PHP family Zn ribbon phosphoesterase